MANFHLSEYKIRTSDFDSRKKLMPASILDFFQDVAGEHAIELGVGRDDVLNENLVWVVVRVKFKILEDIPIYTGIKVRTWPLESNRAIFRREYVIENEDGCECVLGSSEWVLMHIEKRRIVSAKDIIKLEEGFITRTVFEGPLPRIKDIPAEGTGYTFVPGASDIDVNGHVNNTKYANYIYNALDLGENEIIDSFQLEYHREITQNNPVTIYQTRTDKEILVKGINESGEKMFTALIELK